MVEPVSTSYLLQMTLQANVGFMISVNIIKVLGEGGFSFVYLAQDETSGVRGLMSCPPVIISHLFGIHLAAIRTQKDKMSHWVRERQRSSAGGRGI